MIIKDVLVGIPKSDLLGYDCYIFSRITIFVPSAEAIGLTVVK